jgi:hypothetical protein
MDRRETLRTWLKDQGLTAQAYAEIRGVPASVVYKFLQGKDIRLSTWDSIDPGTLCPALPPTPPWTPPDIPPWVHLSEGSFACVSCGAVHEGPCDARRSGPESEAVLFVEIHRRCPNPWPGRKAPIETLPEARDRARTIS